MALKEKQKTLIEELYIQGKSKSEIAKIVNCSYNAVSRHFDKIENGKTETEKNGKNEKISTIELKREYDQAKKEKWKGIVEEFKNNYKNQIIIEGIINSLSKEDWDKVPIKEKTYVLTQLMHNGIRIKDSDIKQQQTKDGFKLNVDNNLLNAINLIKKSKPINVDPQKEIEEFTND